MNRNRAILPTKVEYLLPKKVHLIEGPMLAGCNAGYQLAFYHCIGDLNDKLNLVGTGDWVCYARYLDNAKSHILRAGTLHEGGCFSQ